MLNGTNANIHIGVAAGPQPAATSPFLQRLQDLFTAPPPASVMLVDDAAQNSGATHTFTSDGGTVTTIEIIRSEGSPSPAVLSDDTLTYIRESGMSRTPQSSPSPELPPSSPPRMVI